MQPSMRRRSLLFLLAVCLCGPWGLAQAGEREPFSVVLLPDTQRYSQDFPDSYLAQTEWIKQQAAPQNIRFVIHLGDIVNRVGVKKQWKAADRAHRVLDGVVPYSILPGNHDMKIDKQAGTHDTTMYNRYFPAKRFEGCPWYGGNEDGTNVNNYCRFDAAGMKFLVVSLGFDPSDKTLAWAGKIIDANPDCRAIVAMHRYLDKKVRNNTGDRIWNQLIRTRPSVFLVVCGHVHTVNLLKPTNDAGGTVYEMLADYQTRPRGGDGWLRVLRFVPEANRIDVETYSPTLYRWKRSPDEQFSLPYDMSLDSAM